jgi:hypothetical protein
MSITIPRQPGRPRTAPTVLLPVKMTIDQRKRFKVACAAEELTYGKLISRLLDERDARLARARQRQAHPLHRPEVDA